MDNHTRNSINAERTRDAFLAQMTGQNDLDEEAQAEADRKQAEYEGWCDCEYERRKEERWR